MSLVTGVIGFLKLLLSEAFEVLQLKNDYRVTIRSVRTIYSLFGIKAFVTGDDPYSFQKELVSSNNYQSIISES